LQDASLTTQRLSCLAATFWLKSKCQSTSLGTLKMFWKRKQKTPVETSSDTLYAALKGAMSQGGRIRVEDLISASAAVVGEAAIAEVGDFDPRRHTYVPGTRVFSTNVNRLLCDDKSLEEAPPDSIVGTLREKLNGCGFALSDFPDLTEVFKYFAANIGKEEDWGTVPLSVPQQHYPFLLPLRVAYQSRAIVDQSLAPLGGDNSQRLRATILGLAKALCETRDILNRTIATTLALETVNGMAKTAPMTDATMAAVIEKQKSEACGDP
jgi:hypothetical protein